MDTKFTPKRPTEKIIEKVAVEKPTAQTTIRVSIRSLFPAKLKYTGRVSGESYVWDEAGSVVAVQTEDAPYLLSKKIGSSSCCGASSDGNQLFEQI